MKSLNFIRSFVALALIAFFSHQAMAASPGPITGILPKDPLANPQFTLQVVVNAIEPTCYAANESANTVSAKDNLNIYVGGATAEADILPSFDDGETTPKFYAEEETPDAVQDNNGEWQVTYTVTIKTKGGFENALAELIEASSDKKSLEVAVSFTMQNGETECAAFDRKSQTLSQANFAVNARPEVDTTVLGTQSRIIVKYESPTSVATTGSTTVTSFNATTLNVIYFSAENLATLEANGIPGKKFDKDIEGDYTDVTCALQVTNTTSCVDCGTNGFVNVAALTDGAAYVSGSVSSGSATISGLENDKEYYAFLQYEPTGIQQSRCVIGVPAANSSWTELNGEEPAVATKIRCFIATAAYGSGLHPKVSLFRKFRDEVLLHSVTGRLLVETYYRYSPPLANYIAQRPALRSVIRGLLWVPATLLDLFYK